MDTIASRDVTEPHEDAPETPSAPNRDELIRAIQRRYCVAGKLEKSRLLDEFVARTGYHRKHVVRLLRRGVAASRPRSREHAVQTALVGAWEASGRVGSRRLKVLLPELLVTLERQGKLSCNVMVRGKLHAMSAATIDRLLAPLRAKTSSELLQQRLENAIAALTELADFTLPAKLDPEDQRYLAQQHASVLLRARQVCAAVANAGSATNQRSSE